MCLRACWLCGRVQVEKMEALKDGFRFTFTLPLDEKSLGEFSGQTYTYTFTAKYGSPEIDSKPLVFKRSELSADGRVLEMLCDGIREGFVHEIRLPALRSKTGLPLWHRDAYYTLNRLPKK